MPKPKLVVTADPTLALGVKSANAKNLQTFLSRFGYLPAAKAIPFVSLHDPFVDTAKKPKAGVFDKTTELALKSYQAFHGLPPTGKLDMGTEAEMSRPRCGRPDSPGGGNRVANFVLAGLSWQKTDLTYRISKFSNVASDDDVATAMQAAFDLWSDVTSLTFTRVNANADIDIRFEVGAHGDGDPFDGAMNVLAHAFFPEDGRTHFDDAEKWKVEFPPTDNSAIDLITVAAHEFGHALGLDHSSVRGSLMFPSYQGPHRFLSQDDINGIQMLYPS